MTRCEVLIAGAGPTGLVLALWLTRLKVRVRIIDKAPAPATTSRALAVQARTLELYRQLDLTEELVARGHKVPAVNLWVKGTAKARLNFASIGGRLTPYSFMEIFPQDQHELLLIERLQRLGVAVERGTELESFAETDGQVTARLRGPDGRGQDCEALYLAGCDGARSRVREGLGTRFPGGTYRHVFYVADIDGAGPAVNGELHVDLDEADFLAVFPLAGAGRARLVGTVHDTRAERLESLRFEDVSTRAIEHLKVQVHKVNWFSAYHVHHRVAQHFRRGRAFLLGDAAHIHSPVGGQGMNTGIGDAVNLAWKLAAVLSDRAPEALLDTYEEERVVFARRLVATTDRAFTFVSSDGPLANIVRTRIAPAVLSTAVRFAPIRQFLFRTVSQITLNYRRSALSAGAAGAVRGGDRLPWAAGANGADNFSSLAALTWQAHVYGNASEPLVNWCARHALPLQVFAWRAEHGAAGLRRDALYLLRPDSYVALAAAATDPQTLERYFTDRKLALKFG